MSLKIMALNINVDIYVRSVYKKVPLKNMLYFRKYKKGKFLIVNSSKIIYLFVKNLYFLYFLKSKVFLMGLFLCMLLLQISFYIFKAIFFRHRSARFWNFQKSESGGITGAYVPDWRCLATQLGAPRRRHDEHSGKFFSVQNQGLIEPVGERNHFWRSMLAGLATLQTICLWPLSRRSSASAATWNLHTTQPKYFAPTSSEVVNLTGLL
jgi:hypothetical protein